MNHSTQYAGTRMKLLKCLLMLLFTIGGSAQLYSLPAEVLIIRHAEKATDGSLSVKGKERAAALVPFFADTKELTAHGNPVAIYAVSFTNEPNAQRAVQTVQGVADSLKLTINSTFTNDTFKNMVEEIKSNASYKGKTVLICWEHSMIPDVARAFGALQTPGRWQGESYDRVWKISFSSVGGRPSFQNVPQRLMFGDSAY